MIGDGSPKVRAATLADLPLLQRMLYEAANRPGEQWPSFESSMQEPRNFRFWQGWMRDGDLGVVAERPGAPLGAAWVRRFSGQELGPWDDPEVPVLAVAVERPFRGMGVGMALLKTLLAFATDEGVRAIDLTTGTFNEAAVRLYHSCGFVDIAQRGEAVRMRVVLHPGPSA